MISFIVATSGRPTLSATLQSIECWPGDEIIVVGQHITFDDARARYIYCPAGTDWGHSERNLAIPQARCQYLAHIDDDDIYATNHRAMMDIALRQNPGRPHIFRMQYRNGGQLWRRKIVEVGNVGTPMSLVPNIPSQRGRFGSFYGGDITYLESYAAQAGYASEDFVWNEDVTVLIRPHTAA